MVVARGGRLAVICASFGLGAALILATLQRGTYGLPPLFEWFKLQEDLGRTSPLLAFFAALVALRPVLKPAWIEAARAAGDPLSARRLAGAIAGLAILLLLTAGLALVGTVLCRGGRLPRPDQLEPLLWSGLFVDYLLVVSLAALFTLATRGRVVRLVLGVALFVVGTIILGAVVGHINLIGFGTVPLVEFTRYAVHPVGLAAAWIGRAYWIAVTATLFALRAVLVRWRADPDGLWPGARLALASLAAASATSLALGLTIMRAEAQVRETYSAAAVPLEKPFRRLGVRPALASFAVDIDARSVPGTARVVGVVRLVNETARPLPAILLESAPLLRLTDVRTSAPASVRFTPDHRFIGLELASPLRPGEALEVRYGGSIGPLNDFDKAARHLVTRNGVFLQSAALLPVPRTGDCAVREPQGSCGEGENYLLADPAPGTVAVRVADGVTVAGGPPARLSSRPGRVSIAIDAKAMTNFLVAAAPFKRHVSPARRDCPAIEVLGAPDSSADYGAVSNEVCRIFAYYAKSYPLSRGSTYRIVAVPPKLTEATSYLDGLAIREDLLEFGAAGPELHPLLRIILAHEVAHQFWGYGVVPRNGLSKGFVLEALPQFLAFSYATDRGVLDRKRLIQALSSDAAAFETASADGPPLWQLSQADWRAYLLAPRALLQLDAELPGGFYRPLASAWAAADKGARSEDNAGTLLDHILANTPPATHTRIKARLGGSGSFSPRPAK